MSNADELEHLLRDDLESLAVDIQQDMYNAFLLQKLPPNWGEAGEAVASRFWTFKPWNVKDSRQQNYLTLQTCTWLKKC